MRALRREEIQTALGQLEDGLDRYVWLQRHVGLCDVSRDEDFQTRFNGFYRVRRGFSWRADYFALMESAKATGIEFPTALKEINRRTGWIEASFASKLVATVDPSTPVIDRFVLENFGLKLPRWGLSDRESKTVDVYHNLRGAYRELFQSPTGTMIRELFELRFPHAGITELKKIDLVLWKIRS
jgi:hypothetical protein